MSLISQNGLESNSTLVSGNKKKKSLLLQLLIKDEFTDKVGLP